MTLENTEQTTAPPGESQEFAAIGNLAREVDGAAHEAINGAPEQVPPSMVRDPAENWALIPQMVGQLVVPMAPELAGVYSPEACMNFGRSWALLAEKYGWKNDGLPPEVGAAISAGALVIPTVLVLKMKIEASQRQREAAERSRAAQPFTDVPDGDNATTA